MAGGHQAAATGTTSSHTAAGVPTSKTHLQELIDAYGWTIILGVAALIIVTWIAVAISRHKDDEKIEQAAQAAQAQAAATQQAQVIARQQRVCGTMNEPSCKCQGADTVMRYLPPRRVALLEAKRMKFDPPPGMGYKLCHPDKLDADGNYTDCVDGPEQNLHVGLTVAAVNTSDTDTVALKCEYMP